MISTISGCKDIGIRKSEFVPLTKFFISTLLILICRKIEEACRIPILQPPPFDLIHPSRIDPPLYHHSSFHIPPFSTSTTMPNFSVNDFCVKKNKLFVKINKYFVKSINIRQKSFLPHSSASKISFCDNLFVSCIKN